MITCRMQRCPYFDHRGFCGKPFLNIDQMGMCSVIWYRGQQRRLDWEAEVANPQYITVFDTEFDEVEDNEINEE